MCLFLVQVLFHSISGSRLVSMKREDYTSLGIVDRDAKKIMKELEKLKKAKRLKRMEE